MSSARCWNAGDQFCRPVPRSLGVGMSIRRATAAIANRRSGGGRRLLVAAVLGTLAAGPLPPTAEAQMATADRVQAPGWWPTKGTRPRNDYLGPTACAECHAWHAGGQSTTSMARTATRAAGSEVLSARRQLSLRLGPCSYRIETDDERSVYSVSDGTRSLSAPLAWAFGVGRVGQTFLFEREGRFQESHVSYYDTPKALGVTPGRSGRFAPHSLEEALARPVGDAEARRCFGCHTTASTTESKFDPAGLIPGVTCEACHGPGRAHVAAVKQGQLGEARGLVVNPGRLNPVDSVDFCGACHATWWDVSLAAEPGIAALRSQPHRLQNSACWREGDARITCLACHDPHQPLVRTATAYDQRCLGCHGTAGAKVTRERPGRACKIGTESCTDCHMPKYLVPEMHAKFTDHQIRVVARGFARD